VLTSLLLAFGAVAPAASIAAEPDSSQEGAAPPEQTQDLESDSPSFDPGGETDLPFDSGPPPTSQSPQDSPEDGPVESEPLDDPEGRAVPFVEPETPEPGTPEDAPASPIEEPSLPAPAPGSSEPPANVTPPESQPAMPVRAQQLSSEPGSQATYRQRTWTVVVPVHGATSEGTSAPNRIDSVVAPTASDVSTTTDVIADTGRSETDRVASRTAGDAGLHVVRPGESLWTIAQDLLGPEASATRIAAEVARLWDLNRDRIPSGDPDLIAVGQQLRLR
jgi:resuscitation-promoting factor RpfA